MTFAQADVSVVHKIIIPELKTAGFTIKSSTTALVEFIRNDWLVQVKLCMSLLITRMKTDDSIHNDSMFLA